ncbi:unnamed protein product, partial [Trypanosoma congolense IL3000]
MCLELWGFLLMMATFAGVSLEVSASGDDLFDKLCNITKLSTALLSMDRNSGPLREAIYGRDDWAHFETSGRVKIGWHCNELKLRNTLCAHYTGGRHGLGQDGCFAESLLGTFLCICAPPGGGQPSFFCHNKSVPSGAGWSGRWEE